MLAKHFTKPLQGTALWKFRAKIQGILEYTPDTYLGWDRPKYTFIPIPQECVERSNIKILKRTNELWEGSPVELRKLWERTYGQGKSCGKWQVKEKYSHSIYGKLCQDCEKKYPSELVNRRK